MNALTHILLVCKRKFTTHQQVTGSIIDTDVTLFEVCQLLEYLSQRKEKKESQKAKKNELSLFITA